MASRIERLKYEKEQAKLKEIEEANAKLAAKEAAEAFERQQEEERRKVENERKLARAGLLLRQAMAQNQLQNSLATVLEWRRNQISSAAREALLAEQREKADREAERLAEEQRLKEEQEAELAEQRDIQLRRQQIAEGTSAKKEQDREPNARDSGNRMWAIDHMLDPDVKSQVRQMYMQKVGSTLGNLQAAGYGRQEINAVVRALYANQSEESMKPAWYVFDVGGRGEVDISAFRKAMPLMGENVAPEKMEKLFQEADADGSGTIDFNEFVALMRQLNPMPGDLKKKKFATSAATVATVLDEDIQRKLHPLQKRKAGVIIAQMMGAGYVESHCNAVCRALFMGQSTRDVAWKAAWEVFDTDGSGELDATEFKAALRLMGENVSDQRLETLFNQADQDGSGLIEFEEFVQLMRAMNPKTTLGAQTRTSEQQRKRKQKASKGSVVAATIARDQDLVGWMSAVGISEYYSEFVEADLTDPILVMNMTLVQLGEFLRVSNAERNCLHAKIFSYKRKVENQAALKKTKDKCLYAKERALAAKARAQNLNKKADTIRRSEMEMLQKTAAMRIALSTREAKRRIRDRQEQDAIFDAIGKKPIGVTSASPIKSPSQIRHTLTGTLTRIKSPSPTRGVRGDAPQTSPSSFFPPI